MPIVTEDCMRSNGSSVSNDSSDGGVVFEASTNNDAESDVASPFAEGKHEMQIVPHHLPTPALSCKRRATLYMQMQLARCGTLHTWIERRNAAFNSGNVTAE